jgi:hypothetical protein
MVDYDMSFRADKQADRDPEDSQKPPETLGEWRKIAVALYGEDSGAVKFLDNKIKEQGESEHVIAHETQVLYLLNQLHQRGE